MSCSTILMPRFTDDSTASPIGPRPTRPAVLDPRTWPCDSTSPACSTNWSAADRSDGGSTLNSSPIRCPLAPPPPHPADGPSTTVPHRQRPATPAGPPAPVQRPGPEAVAPVTVVVADVALGFGMRLLAECEVAEAAVLRSARATGRLPGRVHPFDQRRQRVRGAAAERIADPVPDQARHRAV